MWSEACVGTTGRGRFLFTKWNGGKSNENKNKYAHFLSLLETMCRMLFSVSFEFVIDRKELSNVCDLITKW